MTESNLVAQRLEEYQYSDAFMVSDFTDIADYENAKKILLRMEQNGQIRRIFRGVYDKPQFSAFLNEYVAPNPDNVAKALARNFKWEIVPTGNTALNYLGLSTQVPARIEYVSTGPSRKYSYDKTTLSFTHSSSRLTEGLSYKSALVVQALKALGKDYVDEKTIATLRSRLSEVEKKTLYEEAKHTTAWIYSAVKRICREEQ